MACDEAELGPDEFTERMHSQQKLQEQVIFLKLLVNNIGWKWILLKMVKSFVATGDSKAHAPISLGRPICNSWEGISSDK